MMNRTEAAFTPESVTEVLRREGLRVTRNRRGILRRGWSIRIDDEFIGRVKRHRDRIFAQRG
jgi:hypothetical protein